MATKDELGLVLQIMADLLFHLSPPNSEERQMAARLKEQISEMSATRKASPGSKG